MRFYGAILLIDHFINSLNQFRSVGNCLDMFKINFNFEKEKKTLFLKFHKSGRYSVVQLKKIESKQRYSNV